MASDYVAIDEVNLHFSIAVRFLNGAKLLQQRSYLQYLCQNINT
jgi:hypothetical protein